MASFFSFFSFSFFELPYLLAHAQKKTKITKYFSVSQA